MKKGALLESLETVLVVTVIAALIWLYAEGETTSTETRLIKIKFVAPTDDTAVSILDPDTGAPTGDEMRVKAVIQATRGDWARIDDWIRQNTTEIPVRVPQSDTEDQPFNLQDALNLSPLARRNAFIKETELSTLSVRVQRLQTVIMPVYVQKGPLQVSDESPPFPDPNRVPVVMPAELAAQVSDQDLQLLARLDLLDPDTLEPDIQLTKPVSLELPPLLKNQPNVSLNQDSVEVRFIISKVTDEYPGLRVQVRLLISDNITGQYAIKLDDESRFLDITVSGPIDTIQDIRDNPGLVRAWVLIKLTDLTTSGGAGTARLDFDLPDDVVVTAVERDLTTINYTATPLNNQP